MSWLRALVVWVLLMTAEMVHGTIRTLWLAPALGDFRARQVSVFSGAAIILAIVFLCIRWIGLKSGRSLFSMGILWLVLTLLFEIGLGRFVFSYSWERIGQDYDILKGGLLPIGLLLLVLSPLIAAGCRNGATRQL